MNKNQAFPWDHPRFRSWIGVARACQLMQQAMTRAISDLDIKTPGVAAKIAGLSGGNQQKALIARWLNAGTKLLILDEPSRGVDIGAREEIHDAIRTLARSGVGILVISSDVEELALLADRVLVMREGRVTGELTGADITEARIIELSYQDANDEEGDDA